MSALGHRTWGREEWGQPAVPCSTCSLSVQGASTPVSALHGTKHTRRTRSASAWQSLLFNKTRPYCWELLDYNQRKVPFCTTPLDTTNSELHFQVCARLTKWWITSRNEWETRSHHGMQYKMLPVRKASLEIWHCAPLKIFKLYSQATFSEDATALLLLSGHKHSIRSS